MPSNIVSHRHDILILFDVTNGNPTATQTPAACRDRPDHQQGPRLRRVP